MHRNMPQQKKTNIKCFLPGASCRNKRSGRGFLFNSMFNASKWVVISSLSGTVCIPCIKHSDIPCGVFKDRPNRTKSFYSAQRLKKQG